MTPDERLKDIEERLKTATCGGPREIDEQTGKEATAWKGELILDNVQFIVPSPEDIAWLLERVKEKSRKITSEEISRMKSWLSLEGDFDGWNAWTKEANLRHLLYSYEEKLKRIEKLEMALKEIQEHTIRKTHCVLIEELCDEALKEEE